MNLDHPDSQRTTAPYRPEYWSCAADAGCRTRGGAWDFFHVVGDELVDAGGKADDFGSDVVDEYGAVDTGSSRCLRNALGDRQYSSISRSSRASSLSARALRLEHFQWRNVDVAVGDHHFPAHFGSRFPEMPGCPRVRPLFASVLRDKSFRPAPGLCRSASHPRRTSPS